MRWVCRLRFLLYQEERLGKEKEPKIEPEWGTLKKSMLKKEKKSKQKERSFHNVQDIKRTFQEKVGGETQKSSLHQGEGLEAY